MHAIKKPVTDGKISLQGLKRDVKVYDEVTVDVNPDYFETHGRNPDDLVDKIVLYALDKSGDHRKQKIEIYYTSAGIIDIAHEDCVAIDGGQERWQKNSLTMQSGGTAFRLHRHLTDLLRYRTSAKAPSSVFYALCSYMFWLYWAVL